MTDDEMQELRVFAQNRIEENMAKVRLKIGSGLQVRQNDRETLLFMDGAHRFRQPSATPPVWTAAVYGYTISHAEGSIQSGEGEPFTWNETNTSNTVVLATADGNGRFNSSIIDRLSYYRVFSEGVTGFDRSEQTIFFNVPSYQFPVRLTLRVSESPSDPATPSSVSEVHVDFYSDQEYPFIIEQFPDLGRKTVTAISLTRL